MFLFLLPLPSNLTASELAKKQTKTAVCKASWDKTTSDRKKLCATKHNDKMKKAILKVLRIPPDNSILPLAPNSHDPHLRDWLIPERMNERQAPPDDLISFFSLQWANFFLGIYLWLSLSFMTSAKPKYVRQQKTSMPIVIQSAFLCFAK